MVGENIRRRRVEKHMTQDELAERVSVTRQAVSNWERGKTEPDLDTLGRLAEALEVSVEELIYGDEPKEESRAVKLTRGTAERGITFGSALAIVISYVQWHSIGWAIFHGLLSWVYVIYYIFKYVTISA